MNYPTETKHEAMGQGQRTEQRTCVCFFFLPSYIPHGKHALRKESTIKLSVGDLELFDDQR